MKNSISTILLLCVAFISIGVSSCKKDDDEVSKFTYDLNDYIMNQGYLISYGATDKVPPTYQFDVILTGTGITWDNANNDITGKGSYVRFNLFSKKSEFIDGGSYVYDGFDSRDSLTFSYGEAGVDFDFAIDTIFPMEIKTGIVNVKKRSSLYEFDFELYTLENKKIKGIYTGLLIPQNPPSEK